MQSSNEDFLHYYLEELSYLRQAGVRFASEHRKVAARLELHPHECADPHVERLIESFAFLTARIQADLADDFPEIAAELLNVLYPHYLVPVPSMTVVRFEVDAKRFELTSSHQVLRHTQVFTHADEGTVVRFRTAYPVELWPVAVTAAELVAPDRFPFIDKASSVASVLRLRLEAKGEDPFEVLKIDRLRFYLHGESPVVARLYELLMNDLLRVAVLPDRAEAPNDVAGDAVLPVGFGPDEDVIPYPKYSHPAYRMLREYFTLPEKFHFFDVRHLRGAMTGGSVDLLFLFKVPPAKLRLTPETFILGCTPATNLFRQTSEPLRIDHRQLEYRLVPDLRRDQATEIHSIISVSGTSDSADRTREYAPFYSFTHDMEHRAQRAFWHARRVPAQHSGMTGTDVLLSFRDLDFNPGRPHDEIVYAHLLCTNRALAAEIPAGHPMQTDVAVPVKDIVCLKKPTHPVDPPLGGQMLWRLVSHLSLNYLSLGETEDALEALQEILNLYCPADVPALQHQIQGIRRMSHRPVVRRMTGGPAWQGFSRGIEVELLFDESKFDGGSAFLLASVLNQFFGLFASMNSFTQLVIRRSARESEEWKRWRPMVGAKPVL